MDRQPRLFRGAALAGIRAALVPDRQRAGWTAMAVALTLFAAGNLVWTTYVQFMDSVPFPSLQDALFLPFYPIAYVGIVLLARDSLPRQAAQALWLDSVIAAVGAATMVAVVVIAAVANNRLGDWGDRVTTWPIPSAP